MPKLHALLVGIDHYQGEGSLTQACNDVDLMHKYLRNHLNTDADFELNAIMLRNEQAKKEEVTKAFSHFNEVESEDVCLFYFAGHGGVLECPPHELEHLAKTTGKFETIICHDSRGPGGADLTDQEIAHLIGTTVRNVRFSGNGHFAVIMDCCHSGHGTRLELDGESLNTRSVQSRNTQRIEDFYGYTGKGVYPIAGSHVQLAACQHGQRAWDGKYTNSLIDELVCNGALRTYAKIHTSVMNKVNSAMRGHQTPDFYAAPSQLREFPFLGGAVR